MIVIAADFSTGIFWCSAIAHAAFLIASVRARRTVQWYLPFRDSVCRPGGKAMT